MGYATKACVTETCIAGTNVPTVEKEINSHEKVSHHGDMYDARSLFASHTKYVEQVPTICQTVAIAAAQEKRLDISQQQTLSYTNSVCADQRMLEEERNYFHLPQPQTMMVNVDCSEDAVAEKYMTGDDASTAQAVKVCVAMSIHMQLQTERTLRK